MSKEVVGEARSQAEELVARITERRNESDAAIQFSTADRAELTDAIEHDLIAADQERATAEDRLLKIEAQTHVLAEAVIAMAEPSVTLGPAVQAVKDEM